MLQLENGLVALSDFDKFWDIYPRKVAKGAARKAWRQALKQVDSAVIIQGAKRYASERRAQNPVYTKHPATWLSGACWEDEPAPQIQNESRHGMAALALHLNGLDD